MANSLDLQSGDKSIQEIGTQFISSVTEDPPASDDAIHIATIKRVQPSVIQDVCGQTYDIGGNFVEVQLADAKYATPGVEFPRGLHKTFPAGATNVTMPMGVAFAFLGCWQKKWGRGRSSRGVPRRRQKFGLSLRLPRRTTRRLPSRVVSRPEPERRGRVGLAYEADVPADVLAFFRALGIAGGPVTPVGALIHARGC
jgi:hypothetical protein